MDQRFCPPQQDLQGSTAIIHHHPEPLAVLSPRSLGLLAARQAVSMGLMVMEPHSQITARFAGGQCMGSSLLEAPGTSPAQVQPSRTKHRKFQALATEPSIPTSVSSGV